MVAAMTMNVVGAIGMAMTTTAGMVAGAATTAGAIGVAMTTTAGVAGAPMTIAGKAIGASIAAGKELGVGDEVFSYHRQSLRRRR